MNTATTKRGLYNKINAQAFDNFDPDNFGANTVSDRYDPDYMSENLDQPATTTRRARPGQKLQVNLVLNNPTALQLQFELFYAFASCTEVLNPSYPSGAYTYIPSLSTQGLAAAGVGVVGWGQSGELQIRGAALDPVATITCNEYPYKAFYESSKTLPFNVAYVRMTCNTDLQIDNNIKHISKTIGGGIKENVISPRAYFKPNQYQNRTIDILAPFSIDGEKGIVMPVNSGENVRLAFFVERWAKNI